jgi:poly(3-hydroxybutyrate) depolymerase
MLRCSNFPLVCSYARNKEKEVTVINLRKTVGSLLAQRRKWEKALHETARARSAPSDPGSHSSHLQETVNFGSNPGALRMFTYLPAGLAAEGALVVVLHGCAQSAAGYDLGAGWSTLAKRFGIGNHRFLWSVHNSRQLDREG